MYYCEEDRRNLSSRDVRLVDFLILRVYVKDISKYTHVWLYIITCFRCKLICFLIFLNNCFIVILHKNVLFTSWGFCVYSHFIWALFGVNWIETSVFSKKMLFPLVNLVLEKNHQNKKKYIFFYKKWFVIFSLKIKKPFQLWNPFFN